MAHTTLISSSPSPTARSTHLLDLADAALRRRRRTVQRIDIPALPADALVSADSQAPALAAALASVDAAEAIVIALPVSQSSFSGALKLFLDVLPQRGLVGKEVLVLASGTSLSDLLALDCALLPVLSSLGARRIAPHVFATPAQLIAQSDHGYATDESLRERLEHAVAQLDLVLSERAELFAHRAAAIRQRTADFFASLATIEAAPADAKPTLPRPRPSRRGCEALFALD
ncbi:NAD(P)H-dependent oxidoreductase [Chitinasiproducens palmae]|uniref:FMN reductase n=1 Tax=Chitinasiproducens palmae TaxID=1770053 RepID=A0A1H2PQY4_9BURK|nr:NAD(P)H-dependent oxidoreductase [Chitinasiproducens palmae]SDV48858.1 FMN reductase [Chitinasiproducens palmae]